MPGVTAGALHYRGPHRIRRYRGPHRIRLYAWYHTPGQGWPSTSSPAPSPPPGRKLAPNGVLMSLEFHADLPVRYWICTVHVGRTSLISGLAPRRLRAHPRDRPQDSCIEDFVAIMVKKGQNESELPAGHEAHQPAQARTREASRPIITCNDDDEHRMRSELERAAPRARARRV
jgi:hypothetical protein